MPSPTENAVAVRVKYLCTGWHAYLSHHPAGLAGAGVWRTNSAAEAIEFDSEGAAKQFLLEGRYDLNPLQTVFERFTTEAT